MQRERPKQDFSIELLRSIFTISNQMGFSSKQPLCRMLRFASVVPVVSFRLFRWFHFVRFVSVLLVSIISFHLFRWFRFVLFPHSDSCRMPTKVMIELTFCTLFFLASRLSQARRMKHRFSYHKYVKSCSLNYKSWMLSAQGVAGEFLFLAIKEEKMVLLEY